jgi:succinate dehydrogenase / fumarate reductase flavoprotein subunit
MPDKPRVIVVGGGLAGLSASIRIAESGLDVDLFSMVPVKRSHSVCAQGGINACNDVARQQGYSEWMHCDETIYGGDFLNHQPPVYEMCHWAPKIIDLMDRMGVPFDRTKEGRRDLRLFGGSLFKRTHFAGASTGQQLIYALDEQVRRYEADGKVKKYEFWEFLWPVLDGEGQCKGIIAQDMRTMEIKAFRADAVVMATGGCGLIFGKSTMSVICTGGAAARCYQAGAWLGNPEMIQVHPTAIPGEDKCRLMSESARGEGGRLWVPAMKDATGQWKPHPQSGKNPAELPDSERWYFLEEKYPKYKNLVARDVATREIFEVVVNGFGIDKGRQVYLDVSHLPVDTKKKLRAILEIYEKFTGDDPTEVPMKIFPAVHYSMGGLYTTFAPEKRDPRPGDVPMDGPDQPATKVTGLKLGDPKNMVTNIPGLYAFGEVNYNYHGANRLGANALLNCIFDGLFAGLSVVTYVNDVVKNRAASLPASIYDAAVAQENAKVAKLISSAAAGSTNPYDIHRRLGDEMTEGCTVVRTGERLERSLQTIRGLREEYKKVKLTDTGMWTNQNLSFTRALGDMLLYAEAMLIAAIARKESRGSHYRADFKERDDVNFMRTSLLKYNPADDSHTLDYEDVPPLMVQPRTRNYGKTDAPKKEAKEAVKA